LKVEFFTATFEGYCRWGRSADVTGTGSRRRRW